MVRRRESGRKRREKGLGGGRKRPILGFESGVSLDQTMIVLEGFGGGVLENKEDFER